MELLIKPGPAKGPVPWERQKFLPMAAMHPHLSAADQDVVLLPAGRRC